MKIYLTLCLLLLTSCVSETPTPAPINGPASSKGQDAPHLKKQLNLSILLDLSDRIDPNSSKDIPQHFERDSILINYLANFFRAQISAQSLHAAQGKMRIIFSPNPPDAGISKAAEQLSVDLSRLQPAEKKEIFRTLGNTIAENISYIYRTSIRQASWPGSDIWRFFKNDVDIAIDPDSSYRNILVIFTDGYLYHKDSKDTSGNRYAYLLPELLSKYKLRNTSDWAARIDALDFGLISKRADLDQLEVLVLEITPSAQHKNDEDVLRKVLDKWFGEMKVKRWKILNSDLPHVTKTRIDAFLKG
ncbi:hypothetical protein [Chitinophaga rhizophila]|uniref:VWFA domain-containing protein n=1 Tax=Chitinophaga rhizophila TaxID=2866212 RepID=A0ABS7G9K6_9BACT|nr:hypothetical protein [Chitinophaga rhizophila]MBW8684348.1 hypothetical protein [Chitinophaga rhizophila]